MPGYLGDFGEDHTAVGDFFTTHDLSGSPVAPSSAFEAADLVIFRDGATKKATTNGITMTSPADSKTGLHWVSIDTSNETGESSFWTTGSDYQVVLWPDETVDGQAVGREIFSFSIENRVTTTAADILDAAAGVETGVTLRQALRLILAACAGKASGLEGTTAIYRDTGDSKDRITATVDVNGNRTAVTLDSS